MQEVNPFEHEYPSKSEYLNELAEKFELVCTSFSEVDYMPPEMEEYYQYMICKIESSFYRKFINTANYIELHPVDVDEKTNILHLLDKIKSGEIHNAAIDVWTT